jgi:hypothetical protein
MVANKRLAHVVLQTGQLPRDAMLAALRAGTPEAELITRAWASTCAQRDVRALLSS